MASESWPKDRREFENKSGTLVGACGFSAALKLSQIGTSRYFGFAAWIQDYISNEQVRTVGIVTPWGLDHERERVDSWLESSTVDHMLALKKGARAPIKTQNIEAQVVVCDFAFGEGGGPAGSYLEELGIRFDVRTGGS